jgi:antitoxin VapB
MLQLTHDTEQLARKVAARVGRRPDDLIRAALEREAAALGVSTDLPVRNRMTVEQMMAVGEKVSALPLLDPSSPKEILDDLNEQ